MSTTGAAETRLRVFAATRIGWSVALAARPELLLPGPYASDRRARAVVRVLAARELVQSAALLFAPRRGIAWGGVVLDALHAASVLPLALVEPRARRAAARSAIGAVVGAAAGAALTTWPEGGALS